MIQYFPVNPCSSDPCNNSGVCSSNITHFSCNCDGTGYEGTQCDSQVANICDLSSPCLHGTCSNTVDGNYECDCSGTGYIGDNCETGKSDITSSC